MEKISVIIPVYNVADYLQKCLNSVYSQTYNNLEIICVYTKSKDDSYKILKSQKDKRIHIIRRDDGGLGGARNTGMQVATGEYIFFLDSDDWIEDNAIELLYNKIIEEKSDFVVFPFFSYDSENEKVLDNEWGSKLNFDLVRSPFSIKDLPDKSVISENSIVVAWNKLYKKSFLINNQIVFLENLRYEDNPFYYNCLLKANKISFINKKLLYYRVKRKNSLQSTNYDNINVLDIVPIMSDVYNSFKKSSVNANVLKYMENYILNEFVWRYELMNTNTYKYKNMIKQMFNESFYNIFLDKIGSNHKIINSKVKYENNKKIKVSIIVPVYKVEKYIEDCILSIINQSLKEIEILFIDDHSPDDSMTIVREYAKNDKRIHIFSTSENSGAGVARNIGLENAKGNYVIFMDPDDMFANDNIVEKMYNEANRNEYTTICANIYVVNRDSHYKKYGLLSEYNGYVVKENKIIEYKDYDVWSSWGFTRFMYSNKIIKSNNIRFPNVRNYEDPIFLINYISKVNKIYQIAEPMYLYRYIEKKSNVKFETINNIIIGMEFLFDYYKSNELMIQYSNEYRNLVNFINNDFINFINQNNSESKKARNIINSLLEKIDFDIIKKYYNGEIIKKISPIKEKESKIRNILKNIKISFKKIIKAIIIFFIKPFYSRLMNRIDNRIESRMQDIYLQREVLDIVYNRSLDNEKSISTLFENFDNNSKNIQDVIDKSFKISKKVDSINKTNSEIIQKISVLEKNDLNARKKVNETDNKISILNNNVSVIDDKMSLLNNNVSVIENTLDCRTKVVESNIETLRRENVFLKKYVENYKDYSSNLAKYNGGKIRIGILFQIPSFWPSIEELYLCLKNDSSFDIRFFLVNNNKEKSQSAGAKEFLKKLEIDFEYADINNIDKYNPHILILQSPYDMWHREKELYSENLFKKGYRIIYIPYGFEISDEKRSIELQYKLEFYNYCWKIYTSGDGVRNQYLINNPLLENVVLNLGLPKFDSIYNRRFTPIKEKIIHNGKKNILLKIHFSLTMDYIDKKTVTPSIEIYINFLNKQYKKDKYNLYVMLHPKFYDEMDDKTKNLFNIALENSGAILIEDADYRQILYNISAVISDRSGMLLEFSALDIPILYMVNEMYEEKINVAYEYLFNSFDKGKSEKDMYHFIDSVLNNLDLNKKHRNDAFKSCISYFDGKSAYRICEDIKKSLLEEKKGD